MIRTIENNIVFTSPIKPEAGDLMACYAHGAFSKDKHGKRFGEGWYLSYHDDTKVARLTAICAGTEKVNLVIKLPKLK